MKIKINNALLNIILILLFICPVILKFRDFYLVSLASILFTFRINFKYKAQILKKNLFIILEGFIILYSLFILLLTIYLDRSYFLYSLNKVITLMLFIAVINYLSNKDNTDKVSEFIMYSIVITSLISIILYFFGIEGINLTLRPKIIDTSLNLLYYGERRMIGFFEHKIQFSATCLIGAFLVINSNIKTYKKIIYEIILLIAIFLSNSKMALPAVFIIIFLKVLDRWIKDLKKIKSSKDLFISYSKMIIVIICFISLIYISMNIYNNMSQTRDIKSLGQRTIIWKLAINDVKENPIGVLKTYGKTLNNGLSIYSTGHNQILNELLETGVIGGILIFVIMVISLFLISGLYYKIIYLIIVFLAQFDFLITGLFGYIFWIFTAILVINSSKDIKKGNKLL